MSCRVMAELREQGRDEELPRLVRIAFERHVGECPACAREAVLEERLQQAFAALRERDGRVELPADFRREIKERVMAADPRPAAARFRPVPVLAAAAAVVALALLIGLAAPGPTLEAGSLAPSGLQRPPLLYSDDDLEVLDGRTRSQEVALRWPLVDRLPSAELQPLFRTAAATPREYDF